jgi:hypothetical protein
MEDDDWIKFGYVIWASQKGSLKAQAFDSYKAAWQSLYHSDARVEKNGPVDFLHDPQYTCHKPVPWRPQVEARFAPPQEDTDADAGPSTFTPPCTPARAPPPALAPSQLADKWDDSLSNLLKNASSELLFDSNYPRLKGGLLPGFLNYIENKQKKTRLQAVFVIIFLSTRSTSRMKSQPPTSASSKSILMTFRPSLR